MCRRLIISGLLCSVVIAAVLPTGILPGGNADANGDHQVDVRDLQTVIAKVLQNKGGSSAGDANGDGRIDILDFQALLDQVSGGGPADSDHRPPASPSAVLQTLRHESFPVIKCTLPARIATEASVPSAALRDGGLYGNISPSREILYVLGRAQHAPPCRA